VNAGKWLHHSKGEGKQMNTPVVKAKKCCLLPSEQFLKGVSAWHVRHFPGQGAKLPIQTESLVCHTFEAFFKSNDICPRVI
jgi:hypothetical protein